MIEAALVDWMVDKGTMAVVIGWFMFRLEGKLDKITDALNNQRGIPK